jgi:hypothetical protein
VSDSLWKVERQALSMPCYGWSYVIGFANVVRLSFGFAVAVIGGIGIVLYFAQKKQEGRV